MTPRAAAELERLRRENAELRARVAELESERTPIDHVARARRAHRQGDTP